MLAVAVYLLPPGAGVLLVMSLCHNQKFCENKNCITDLESRQRQPRDDIVVVRTSVLGLSSALSITGCLC